MKVRTVDGTLLVQSAERWYCAESVGIKNCTARLVDTRHWDAIADFDPDKIEVRLSGTDESFTRRITWMGSVGSLLGKELVIVCWDSP